jgi:hypothetical protein
MRHVGSLIAGMLIAPIAWLLIALGQQKSTETVAEWVQQGAFDSVDLIAPAASVSSSASSPHCASPPSARSWPAWRCSAST